MHEARATFTDTPMRHCRCKSVMPQCLMLLVCTIVALCLPLRDTMICRLFLRFPCAPSVAGRRKKRGH